MTNLRMTKIVFFGNVIFWAAIIKAGVQGAIYVIDCFRQGTLSGYDKTNYIVPDRQRLI